MPCVATCAGVHDDEKGGRSLVRRGDPSRKTNAGAKVMRHFKILAVGVLAAATLSACSRSNPVDQSAADTEAVAVPKTQYDMANGCYSLKSLANNDYAVHGSDGSYAATAAALKDGEPLYLKPTALGKYICFASELSMLVVSGNGVGSVN